MIFLESTSLIVFSGSILFISPLNAKWKQEKTFIQSIQQRKEWLEQLRLEAEQAEHDFDYGKVAEIWYGQITNIELVPARSKYHGSVGLSNS